jgi:hypothetical protein
MRNAFVGRDGTGALIGPHERLIGVGLMIVLVMAPSSAGGPSIARDGGRLVFQSNLLGS